VKYLVFWEGEEEGKKIKSSSRKFQFSNYEWLNEKW
jgi:hypothetical protein